MSKFQLQIGAVIVQTGRTKKHLTLMGNTELQQRTYNQEWFVISPDKTVELINTNKEIKYDELHNTYYYDGSKQNILITCGGFSGLAYPKVI